MAGRGRGRGLSPRFPPIEGFSPLPHSLQLTTVAGMTALGAERAIPLLEEMARQPGLPAFAAQAVATAISRLKQSSSR